MPGVNGRVARAVLGTPEARRLYRGRIEQIFTNLFRSDLLTNQVSQLAARLEPQLKAYDAGLAREFCRQRQRPQRPHPEPGRRPGQAIQHAGPQAAKFEGNVARLGGWRQENERGGAKLDQVKDAQGKQTLWVAATGNTTASWRTRILLEDGHYRFEAWPGRPAWPPCATRKGRGPGCASPAVKSRAKTPWRRLQLARAELRVRRAGTGPGN